ncbi:hypothetical protein [Gottfriedia luciferensis]|nr:hypothetical protein [Gottfriedia luciferensis]
MNTNEEQKVEEPIKSEMHIKKYNWLLMLLAVVTIPFLVTNM